MPVSKQRRLLEEFGDTELTDMVSQALHKALADVLHDGDVSKHDRYVGDAKDDKGACVK